MEEVRPRSKWVASDTVQPSSLSPFHTPALSHSVARLYCVSACPAFISLFLIFNLLINSFVLSFLLPFVLVLSLPLFFRSLGGHTVFARFFFTSTGTTNSHSLFQQTQVIQRNAWSIQGAAAGTHKSFTGRPYRTVFCSSCFI